MEHTFVLTKTIHQGFSPLLTAYMVVVHPNARKLQANISYKKKTILEKAITGDLMFTDGKHHSKNDN